MMVGSWTAGRLKEEGHNLSSKRAWWWSSAQCSGLEEVGDWNQKALACPVRNHVDGSSVRSDWGFVGVLLVTEQVGGSCTALRSQLVMVLPSDRLQSQLTTVPLCDAVIAGVSEHSTDQGRLVQQQLVGWMSTPCDTAKQWRLAAHLSRGTNVWNVYVGLNTTLSLWSSTGEADSKLL